MSHAVYPLASNVARYKEVMKIIDQGGELSMDAANVVAKAMKDWAVEHGATHYTHWFQPLTGITAEKHDAFVAHPDESGRMHYFCRPCIAK